jgi:hypothetical protein
MRLSSDRLGSVATHRLVPEADLGGSAMIGQSSIVAQERSLGNTCDAHYFNKAGAARLRAFVGMR